MLPDLTPYIDALVTVLAPFGLVVLALVLFGRAWLGDTEHGRRERARARADRTLAAIGRRAEGR